MVRGCFGSETKNESWILVGMRVGRGNVGGARRKGWFAVSLDAEAMRHELFLRMVFNMVQDTLSYL